MMLHLVQLTMMKLPLTDTCDTVSAEKCTVTIAPNSPRVGLADEDEVAAAPLDPASVAN